MISPVSPRGPLRVGLIGCGSFATKHAELVSGQPVLAQLVAFCDPVEDRAQAFAARFAPQAAIYTDHHALFDQAALDMVVIAIPPFAHTDEVMLAAERGIHVLIEKPIALDADLAWKMVEAAEAAKIKTQVGFMFRFGEAVEHYRALKEAGKTGPTALMTARYFCNALHADWWRMREKSGGQVVEQVIHMFDLLRYLGGEAQDVYSRQENLFHREVEGYTSEDVSATIIGLEGGGMGVIYATNNAIPGKWINDFKIVAQRVTADFTNANNGAFTQTDLPGNPVTVIETDKNIRRLLLVDLLKAIHFDGSTRVPIREGAKSLDLVLAAARSAQQGGVVRL